MRRPSRRLLLAVAAGAPLAFDCGRAGAPPAAPAEASGPAVEVFRMEELMTRRALSGEPRLDFFQGSTLRLGLLEMVAGSEEPETAAPADCVYSVVEGFAVLEADGESFPVEPGSVARVRAGVSHRFRDIEEGLSLLVVSLDGDALP